MIEIIYIISSLREFDRNNLTECPSTASMVTSRTRHMLQPIYNDIQQQFSCYKLNLIRVVVAVAVVVISDTFGNKSSEQTWSSKQLSSTLHTYAVYRQLNGLLISDESNRRRTTFLSGSKNHAPLHVAFVVAKFYIIFVNNLYRRNRTNDSRIGMKPHLRSSSRQNIFSVGYSMESKIMLNLECVQN